MQNILDTPSTGNSSVQNSSMSKNCNDSGVHEDLESPSHASFSNSENHGKGELSNCKQEINSEALEGKGSGDSEQVDCRDEDLKDVHKEEKVIEAEGHSSINQTDKENSSTRTNDQNDKNSNEDNDEDSKEPEWIDILGSGQLKKKVLRKGANDFRPQNLMICEVNIEGQLKDGKVVEKHTNLKFQLGDLELVQGLDLALPLMDVGEEALVEVGPRFAYGYLGLSPDIPGNATITYHVELLSAEYEPDMEELTVSERSKIGTKKRERGNWWYERENYTAAIQCYRRAVEYLDEVNVGVDQEPKTKKEDDEEHSLLEDRLKVFNNLAAAQMKIKSYDTALESVEKVLMCQPRNVKALFRKGKILASKGETATAITILRQASHLEPESKTIKQELLRLLSQNKRETKMEKNLYKRMLGQDKTSETSNSKSSKFYQMRWGVVFGSIAAMLAGVVAYRYKFL